MMWWHPQSLNLKKGLCANTRSAALLLESRGCSYSPYLLIPSGKRKFLPLHPYFSFSDYSSLFPPPFLSFSSILLSCFISGFLAFSFFFCIFFLQPCNIDFLKYYISITTPKFNNIISFLGFIIKASFCILEYNK